jgi:hypothetical protein
VGVVDGVLEKLVAVLGRSVVAVEKLGEGRHHASQRMRARTAVVLAKINK